MATTDAGSEPLIDDKALDEIMALPGIPQDDVTREAIRGILATLFVDARWEGVQEGPED